MRNLVSSIFMTCLLLLSLVQYGNGQEPADKNVQDRSGVKCFPDSPERRGDEGCTILASKPMSGPVPPEVYWHIDRFDSLDAAKKAAGPNGLAAEAHGGIWLMTVEGKSEDHNGGRHVALIGPLTLPATKGYKIEVRSTLLKDGASTPVHTHSGPEVFYIVTGEQCLETEKTGNRIRAGESFIVPADQLHRGRVQNVALRGALVLVLHDDQRPASHDPANPPPLVPCKVSLKMRGAVGHGGMLPLAVSRLFFSMSVGIGTGLRPGLVSTRLPRRAN